MNSHLKQGARLWGPHLAEETMFVYDEDRATPDRRDGIVRGNVRDRLPNKHLEQFSLQRRAGWCEWEWCWKGFRVVKWRYRMMGRTGLPSDKTFDPCSIIPSSISSMSNTALSNDAFASECRPSII
jgi:hypothetical protein